MKPIKARISRKQPDGTVLVTDFEIPCKTGDEGFRFLEEFVKRCGPVERDAERDRRWVELQAKIARKQA